MKMQDTRGNTKKWGVNIKVGCSKQDIIRDIQVKEGYSPVITQKMIARTIAYGNQIV